MREGAIRARERILGGEISVGFEFGTLRVRIARVHDEVSQGLSGNTGRRWPVAVEAVGRVSCGSLIWRLGTKARATIIVAATFEIPSGEMMRRVLAEPIAIADIPHASGTSTYISTDLVPFRKFTDVVLTGYASAPSLSERQSMSVRLAVMRERTLLDKTIQVIGDHRGTRSFQRMPLVYERAYGGPGIGENPVGTGTTVDSPAPNLIHPTDPQRVACFGPLHQSWPIRARYLEGLDPLAFEALNLPSSFDLTYFQAAPEDQRIGYLHGDEWIVLDGMTAMMPRQMSQLPMTYAQARIWGHPDLRAGHLLNLVGDTLRIDADRMTCTVVWRAGFPIAAEESRWKLRVIAGVESKDEKTKWPEEWRIVEKEHPPPPRVPATPHIAHPRHRVSSIPPSPAPRASWFSQSAPTPEVQTAQPEAAPPQQSAPKAEPAPVNLASTVSGVRSPLATETPVLPFVKGPSTLPPPSQSLPPAEDDQTPALDERVLAEVLSKPVLPFASPAAPVIAPIAPPIAPPVAPSVATFSPVPEVVPFVPSAPIIVPEPFTTSSRAPEEIALPPDDASEDKPTPPKDEPSEVTPEGIRLYNKTPLSFMVCPWKLSPSRDCFTVVARATATFVSEDNAKLLERSDPLTGEVVVEADEKRIVVYPSDLVPYKVRADVVVVGHAYAPNGEATEMDVELSFGKEPNTIHRKIHVFGDRQWHKGARGFEATAPTPFARIPLQYERAFGGPAFVPNPAGIGFVDRAPGSAGPTVLANLEDPDTRVRLPNQKVVPICFAPMPLAWAARRSASGAKTAPWPFVPEDLDWTRYQAAPPEQRLPFLCGDEPFTLVGMHPTKQTITGKLPGIAPRCFAVREESGSFEEVALWLDTVVLSPDASKMDLVWRGWLPVVEESKPELRAVYLVTEPLAEPPKSLEQMREMLKPI